MAIHRTLQGPSQQPLGADSQAQLGDEPANHPPALISDRAEAAKAASAPAEKSAPQVPMQFVRVFESMDGDLALFRVIAEKAVLEFQRSADRLDALLKASDLQGLASEAHKLCSVWALYAKAGEEGMAAQLERSAKGGDGQVALLSAGQLVTALRDAGQSLLLWHSQTQGQTHQ